jgi:hypothetical protein
MRTSLGRLGYSSVECRQACKSMLQIPKTKLYFKYFNLKSKQRNIQNNASSDSQNIISDTLQQFEIPGILGYSIHALRGYELEY